jgi:hypothetical protein
MRTKLPLPALLLLLCLFLLSGPGCNNFEIPVRAGGGREQPEGELKIRCERAAILDTEPLTMEAENARGLVTWEADTSLECRFEPPSGDRVLFFPPDLTGSQEIAVIARDEGDAHASIRITVVDEGLPPEPGDLLINEVGWAGTLTSAYDEYLELINTAERPFYLFGWRIENAAGTGKPVVFSGRIEAKSWFVIANYDQGAEKSALECPVQVSDASLSLSNSCFGPFALRNDRGELMDRVGDGNDHLYGINSSDTRSSLSRYSWANSTRWTPEHWYTESVSVNLCDGTLGTPGAPNSDIPVGGGQGGENARGILTEYAIDPDDEIGEDWAEIFIMESGSLMSFVLTDLDGEDAPITCGQDISAVEGEYYVVVWHDYDEGYDFEAGGYLIEGNRIYIPDHPPAGTKDQIVLLCAGRFMDGLCYYTEGNSLYDDDEPRMREYGWTGDPVQGKHAARLSQEDGSFLSHPAAESWDANAQYTPGAPND